MSKKLITAETIRDIKAKGQTQIEVSLTDCIITPEAKEVAAQLDIVIVENTCSGAVTNHSTTSSSSNCSSLNEADLKVVRQAIIEKLPKGATVSDALIDQLVCRAVQEGKCTATNNSASANQKPSGIKLVKGNSAKLEIFEGAGLEKKVGIADMIGAADNSNMGAGYMAWENAFFPWTLNYDEVDIVLEGELHICHQNEVKIAKAGDMIFIPKGSSIQFGTPTKVRFVYVSWPANWQDQ